MDRSRYVTCSALDWPLIGRSNNLHFYPEDYVETIVFRQLPELQKPYILFFHSTARAAKRWSNSSWVALGQHLSLLGYQIVLPWGSSPEKAMSNEIASQIPNALVPNSFSIEEAFSIIANARLVVGVDTGLTHLSAVLNKPTIEIYSDSPRWKTEGYWSGEIRNLGDIQDPPSADKVIKAATELLAQ